MLVGVMLAAALATGCGSENTGLDRTQVEDRVATEVGTNEGDTAKAECVEGSKDRTFRCEVTVENATSRYDVLVSKDGERLQLDQR